MNLSGIERWTGTNFEVRIGSRMNTNKISLKFDFDLRYIEQWTLATEMKIIIIKCAIFDQTLVERSHINSSMHDKVSIWSVEHYVSIILFSCGKKLNWKCRDELIDGEFPLKNCYDYLKWMHLKVLVEDASQNNGKLFGFTHFVNQLCWKCSETNIRFTLNTT